MMVAPSRNRDELHRIVDELPEGSLSEARVYLEGLRGAAMERALAQAPEDDEAVADDDIAAVREAREARARGDVISQEDLERELGLR